MVLEAYYVFLTNILQPILVYPLFLLEIGIAVLITLAVTLFSKRFVNQEQLRSLKEQQKALREKQKELQKTNPEKLSEITNEILKLSNKQMSLNMRTTIITLIVVMAILPWLSYISSVPTTSFVVNQENVYFATFDDSIFHANSKTAYFQINNFTKEGDKSCFLFSCSQVYNYTFDLNKDGDSIFEIKGLKAGDNVTLINNWVIGGVKGDKVYLGLISVNLPFYLPYFGYKFGWLMWYIVLSFPLSFLFRKMLGVEQ